MVSAKILLAKRTISAPHSLLVGLNVRNDRWLGVYRRPAYSNCGNFSEQVPSINTDGDDVHPKNSRTTARNLCSYPSCCRVVEKLDLTSRRSDFVFEFRHKNRGLMREVESANLIPASR